MRSRKRIVIYWVMLFLPVILIAIEQAHATSCPDGSNEARNKCNICSDGTYVGALSCKWTGRGYAAGQPIVRPDLRNRVLCPDGITYVIGSSCVLKPDGRFVGGVSGICGEQPHLVQRTGTPFHLGLSSLCPQVRRVNGADLFEA